MVVDRRGNAVGPGRLPVRSIFDLVPDGEKTEVLFQNFFEVPLLQGNVPAHPAEISGTSLADAYSMVLLLKTTPAKTIVEYGTSYGHAALLFALNSPADAIIYTTDFPERPAIGTVLKGSPYAQKIRQSFEMTNRWDLSFLKGKVDFQFIDAGHGYEDVLSDSAKAFDLVAPGGIICWHDYTMMFRRDVIRALDEIAERQKRDLVKIRNVNLVVYRHPLAGAGT